MPHPEQLQLVLPNETVDRLNLLYMPFHWPCSDRFPEYGGFSIEKGRGPYAKLQKLLEPNHDKWIEAECIAALVPNDKGNNFSLQVNGVTLSSSLYESERLKKLFRQKKMPLLVTTCNARISGGGMLADGRKRGYGIVFDVAALRELDALRRQRSNEKGQLFRVFVYPIIADHAKKKFFELFGNSCFKCGSHHHLEIDHHVPIVLAGHLVPGNLVALCKICNNKKLDSPPEAFYSPKKLNDLKPLFAKQHQIFSFTFDWEHWRRDRESYLLSLGIDPTIVHEALNNPDHRFYIEPPSEREGFVIAIDLNEIVQKSGLYSKASKE
jgi:5-methylcytosine-specific restriction endonuclease McrA